MIYNKCLPKLALTISLFAASTSQAANVDGSDSMETMVVVAAREPISTDQTGSAVSTIDAAALARRQSISIGEMLRSLPGIAVSRAGGMGAQSQLRVRGGEANHVLVMIDGIAVNDPSQGDEFNLAHLYNHQLAQVEFLRGPQSALWGSDAVAGVINVISSRPSQGQQFNAVVEGGSDEYILAGLNAGWSANDDYAALSVHTLDTAGHNIARQGDEEDGYNNARLNFSGGTSLTENIDLSTAWHYVDSTVEFDGVDFGTGLPADQNNETKSAQLYGHLTGFLTALDGRWRQRVSIHVMDSEHKNETENSFSIAGFDRSSNRAEVLRYNYQSHFDLNSHHTFSAAIEYEEREFRQRAQASFYGNPNRDETLDTSSMALEYRGQWWGNAYVQASVRHDRNNDFEDSTTWRASLAWRPANTTKLRASLGTGVKNPTFTERFGYFTNFIGNSALQPETSQGWELGIDQHFKSFNFQLTYFRADLEDEIDGFVFLPASLAFTAANDDGRSARRGVEASAQWQASQWLNITGAYTWLDATEKDAFRRDVDEVRRPRNTASLEITLVPSERWDFFLRADHNGKQDDVFFPPVPPFQSRVQLDDFTLLSVGMQVQATVWLSVFGRLENALGDEYEEVFGFSTPGRVFRLGLRLQTNRK